MPDGASQSAGELLEPRRQIYRGADAGEIEPVAAADIAVEHLAQMKRQAEAHRGASPPATCKPPPSARVAWRPRAPRRNGPVGPRLGHREYRQQPVADEFQHLAAMLDDRRHLAIEIAIEQSRPRIAAAAGPRAW